MSQLGVFLARQELRVVFDNFDQNKDGNIAYNEFVNVLKVSVLSPLILHSPAPILRAPCKFETAFDSNLAIQTIASHMSISLLSGFSFARGTQQQVSELNLIQAPVAFDDFLKLTRCSRFFRI